MHSPLLSINQESVRALHALEDAESLFIPGVLVGMPDKTCVENVRANAVSSASLVSEDTNGTCLAGASRGLWVWKARAISSVVLEGPSEKESKPCIIVRQVYAFSMSADAARAGARRSRILRKHGGGGGCYAVYVRIIYAPVTVQLYQKK